MRRRLAWRETVGACVLFGIVALAYLAPVLVGGHVLSPATLLYDVPPWSLHRTVDAIADYNRLLSDHPTAFHPWLDYARQHIRTGGFPQWNPYELAGTPFLGNAQAAYLSPFSVPAWVLPLNYAFGVQAALRLWVAALGSYLIARRLGLRFWPGIVTGLSYGFAPVVILWLSHPASNMLALAPWVLWALEGVLQGGRRTDVVWLAGVTGVMLLGGHPGSEIHVMTAAVLYGATRLATMGSLREAARRGGLAVSGGALGVVLAMAALLPAYLLVPGSSGSEGRSGGGPVVPAEAWRTLLFPDWWGRPSGLDLGGPFNYNERTLYAGTVALVLAAFAVTCWRDRRSWAPFAVLGVVGFTVPLAIAPFHDVAANLPGLSHVQNARMSFLLTLAVAVLAGFGAERLTGVGRPSRAVVVAICACVIGIAGVAATHGSIADIRTTVNHFRTSTDFPGRPHVVELTSVGWWLLLSGLVLAAVLVATLRRAGWHLIVLGLLLSAILLDLGHFAHGYQPMPEARYVFPDPPPDAIRLLQRVDGPDRVTGIRFSLPPDAGMVYGLRDIRGHDPPEPDLRYLALFRLANPAQSSASYLQIPAFTAQARRVMDILGVRYVIDAPGLWAPQLAGIQTLYAGKDATVFVNNRAAARVYLPKRILTARDAEGSLRALADPAFRAGRDAVVEVGGVAPPAAKGQLSLARDSADRVDVRAQLNRRGLVVLNDELDRGWSVTVDSRSATVVRVNSVVRGVVVPAGAHTITWRYTAPGLVPGAVMSLLGLVALVLLSTVPGGRRRLSRRSSRPPMASRA